MEIIPYDESEPSKPTVIPIVLSAVLYVQFGGKSLSFVTYNLLYLDATTNRPLSVDEPSLIAIIACIEVSCLKIIGSLSEQQNVHSYILLFRNFVPKLYCLDQ